MLLSINFYSFIKCCRPTQTTHVGKWPRGRIHHRPSTENYNPGQGGIVRGRGQLVRGRGELMRGGYFHGRGGRGGYYGEHSSTPSTTAVYTNALDALGHTLTSIVSVG